MAKMIEGMEMFRKEVNEATGKPVLVDFWAEWCGPCRQLGPIVEEIAEELKDKLAVCKCDVDKNEEVAAEFGIRSIPTLMLFKDGKAIDTKVGASSKAVLLEWLKDKASI